MLEPATDTAAQPSSPTISSFSSSDFDTESTGSFFHDRSTTLGTLMGVTAQAIAIRASSQHLRQEIPAAAAVGGGRWRSAKPRKSRAEAARQRWRWWSLCRDDCDAGRASLGEYLEVERRFGDGGPAAAPANGRALFANGRLLPPAEVVGESSPAAAGICRFSAMERCCSLV